MSRQIETVSSLPWFAVRVKANHERRVAEFIDHQGFEQFLPIYRVRRKWAQRWQDLDIPLFAGYVFCKFDRSDWSRVMKTPGVIDVVRCGSALATVDNDEIRALQLVQKAKLTMKPSPFLQVGHSVSVRAGPFAGMKGVVVDIGRATRLILSITLLQRSVAVEVEHAWLTADHPLLHGETQMPLGEDKTNLRS